MSCAPFLSVTPRTLPWALLPPQSQLGSGSACGARGTGGKVMRGVAGLFLVAPWGERGPCLVL